MYWAERRVFLVAARILWVFDTVFAKDVQGTDIIVSAGLDTAYHHSAVGSPKLFSVQIRVRIE